MSAENIHFRPEKQAYREVKVCQQSSGAPAGGFRPVAYIAKKRAGVVQRASQKELPRANISAGLEGDTMTDREVLLESVMLIVAGSGTTGAVTMIFLMRAVRADPEIESRLEEKLEELPYSNAVINEARRLCGAAPLGLPRIVPGAGFNVWGHHSPGGSIVTTQSYSLLRDGQLVYGLTLIPPWTVAGRAAAGKGHLCALGWREPDMFMAVEILPRVSALRWRKGV
ncbi:uncharacterized protein BO66DRAFT_436893 [Aspergillus aculeatinus CBS 121060]|uniref:Uncharacterized protein n=1 Tax=Aspergillus aculeatinus CBS 121060 TaxID=1448322 RepID=A0ACD1HEH0_9EURO|nr:hypothetical protein BO66DRAFT_436893 [Aspergillus aculeatinus CBS 121060]RAH72031.1 hypothetical protein BO66DRAFT_436893 [Aspergillus aculeatinus CBS 121060]